MGWYGGFPWSLMIFLDQLDHQSFTVQGPRRPRAPRLLGTQCDICDRWLKNPIACGSWGSFNVGMGRKILRDFHGFAARYGHCRRWWVSTGFRVGQSPDLDWFGGNEHAGILAVTPIYTSYLDEYSMRKPTPNRLKLEVDIIDKNHKTQTLHSIVCPDYGISRGVFIAALHTFLVLHFGRFGPLWPFPWLKFFQAEWF